MRRLAVIPSDPLEAYFRAGYSKKFLQEYYNPDHTFDEVYLLSPFEPRDCDTLGLHVMRTSPFALKGRIKKLGIDVVRAYGGYWACDLACNNKVDGIPVIVSVHDDRPDLLHNSIKRADVVFCVSEVVKKLVLTRVGNPDRVWLLPNRVDFSVMRPYSKEETRYLDQEYPYRYKILHVGRKTDQKNLDTVIKALKILGKDYCLLAVGREEDPRFRELAKKIGVIDHCYFIDALNNEVLGKYYSFADCMCTPSRWEGFGIVFIEALASEAIVVTSDKAPMNEFITHMKNGLLVEDYENPEALAEMIKIACTDGNVRMELKGNARSSVEKFEIGKINSVESEYYNRVLQMRDNDEFRRKTIAEKLFPGGFR